jgi:acyl carrier protein
MPADDLYTAVAEIIARKKKIDPSSVTPDTTFDALGIDSLDGMDLVFTFEDTFNINIPDQVAQQMTSVGEVVDAVRREIEKQPRPAA